MSMSQSEALQARTIDPASAAHGKRKCTTRAKKAPGETEPIRFIEEDRILDFSISGYQYPNAKAEDKKYGSDVNWLNCRFRYCEGGKWTNFKNDACLMTDELWEIIHGLEDVLDEKSSCYISDFLEPELRITILRNPVGISFAVEYIYGYSTAYRGPFPWPSKKLTMNVSDFSAKGILDELYKWAERYPDRYKERENEQL